MHQHELLSKERFDLLIKNTEHASANSKLIIQLNEEKILGNPSYDFIKWEQIKGRDYGFICYSVILLKKANLLEKEYFNFALSANVVNYSDRCMPQFTKAFIALHEKNLLDSTNRAWLFSKKNDLSFMEAFPYLAPSLNEDVIQYLKGLKKDFHSIRFSFSALESAKILTDETRQRFVKFLLASSENLLYKVGHLLLNLKDSKELNEKSFDQILEHANDLCQLVYADNDFWNYKAIFNDQFKNLKIILDHPEHTQILLEALLYLKENNCLHDEARRQIENNPENAKAYALVASSKNSPEPHLGVRMTQKDADRIPNAPTTPESMNKGF